MCGIAAYIGERDSLEILFGMLERLEYRGYDSAGVALATGNGLMTAKDEGRVHEVHRLAEESWSSNGGSLSRGLSHCRWATHGKPSKANAHPHADCTGQILVVHNGIVENYMQLKEELLARGHEFVSATDTEVIPHLIEELSDGDFEKAFRDCLVRLEGSFAVCAMSVDEPDRLFVARKESPLIIGLGDGENFVASDAPAVIPETRDVIYLDDFDYAVVGKDGVQTKNLRTGAPIVRQPKKVDWDVGRAEKGGHDHFMLKEILEEPEAVSNALKAMRDIERITKKLAKFNRIYFVACGTAAYAGLCGKYLLERFAIPSETVLGSEFRYSTALTIDPNCAVVALSQSGETADTIASVKEAKKRGAYVVSIVNAIGSTLPNLSDDNIMIYAGPEIAVASTKAYVGKIVILTQLALFLAWQKGLFDGDRMEGLLAELKDVPAAVNDIVLEREKVRKLAEGLSDKEIFFYIGRRLNYPTALEGALKIKEISYVHAEAYPAGELKHGPLALLEEGVPVVAISSTDDLAGKMESNIQEARARQARVVTVGGAGSDLEVPGIDPLFSPIVSIIPLHLFAYYVSVSKGIDPDKPRNLAKSVTVE